MKEMECVRSVQMHLRFFLLVISFSFTQSASLLCIARLLKLADAFVCMQLHITRIEEKTLLNKQRWRVQKCQAA